MSPSVPHVLTDGNIVVIPCAWNRLAEDEIEGNIRTVGADETLRTGRPPNAGGRWMEDAQKCSARYARSHVRFLRILY